MILSEMVSRIGQSSKAPLLVFGRLSNTAIESMGHMPNIGLLGICPAPFILLFLPFIVPLMVKTSAFQAEKL